MNLYSFSVVPKWDKEEGVVTEFPRVAVIVLQVPLSPNWVQQSAESCMELLRKYPEHTGCEFRDVKLTSEADSLIVRCRVMYHPDTPDLDEEWGYRKGDEK